MSWLGGGGGANAYSWQQYWCFVGVSGIELVCSFLRRIFKTDQDLVKSPYVWRLSCLKDCMYRVGQNLIYAPYITVYLVTSLPKIP